jgi:hypothetical protein
MQAILPNYSGRGRRMPRMPGFDTRLHREGRRFESVIAHQNQALSEVLVADQEPRATEAEVADAWPIAPTAHDQRRRYAPRLGGWAIESPVWATACQEGGDRVLGDGRSCASPLI